MMFLVILGAIVAILCFIILAAFFIVTLQYLVFFKWRNCKYCHHHMDFRGLKEVDDNSHYLFHCPNCGAWEQIPKEEFLRQCANPVNKDNKKHGKTNNS